MNALYVGVPRVVLHRFDAAGFPAAVACHHVTRSFMVPAHVICLLELPDKARERYDVPSLRHVVHAAARAQ